MNSNPYLRLITPPVNKVHAPPVFFWGVLQSRNFHEPRVGTGTTGPGEAVSAIRCLKCKDIE